MSRPRIIVLCGLAFLAATTAAWFVIGGRGSEPFMPHAHCYLFNEQLMLLHGGSDLMIGLSYLAISATLFYLVFRAQRELPFHWMMIAFAVFIVACGMTHFMEVWTLRAPEPQYWLSGWVKFLTAAASLVTAVLLPPLVPKIRAVLQSARLASERKAELEKAYAELTELHHQTVGRLPPVVEADDPEAAHNLAKMAKDVTMHARDLERAKQEAEAANRAKDQFLAVLSHELRTPLTPALAAATNLENSLQMDPAELRESLALIRRNIELEARLVDDLLDITRIRKGKLEVHRSNIDLHETVRHAVEMCRSVANNQRLKLQLSLEAADYYVTGDGARLAQVFWNLILNAVKFTPAGGQVDVRTCNPKPGAIRIEVRDNGIGIEPEMQTRIFEPFQQGEDSTPRRFGGVGLGLSIAKGLITAHGGTITAASDGKNHGAAFVVELATTAPPEKPKETGASLSLQPANRSLRVLLVEDHEDTRHALERLLKRWGHDVSSAATLAQAVEIAPAFQPELLLSDVGLPDGTGMELLEKLSGEAAIPAIAMSGYGMESDLEQTRHAGFLEHLVKPVPPARLKEVIEKIGSSLRSG